ncbi:MAG TPA: GNAT family N-acyltransferase, partial [Candidatus Binatia bacterium]|nr:GNAT family N-acyltransferase [Candidatus Binatia bacterium]
ATGADVRAAQRLRYEVFATELAASLPSEDEGLDRDAFDPHCEHLLVRDETTGRVVGTASSSTSPRLVIGCASIPVLGDPPAAARICRRLSRDHLAPPEWRVVPRRPFRLHTTLGSADVRIPPLIRGYLKMGALVCGDAAWDADFGTADLLLALPVRRMRQPYAGRFLKAS